MANHGGDILRQLHRAYLPALNDYNNIFITHTALKNALDGQSVRTCLQQLFSDLPVQELDVLVNYVCPRENLCSCGRAWCTGGRIIFASLLQIGEEGLINSFHSTTNPHICDTNLLLLEDERTDEHTPEPVSEIAATGGTHRPEEFANLDPATRKLFFHIQWQMRAPFIEMINGRYTNVDNNAPLPWTKFHYRTVRDVGQLSRIAEISIDDDHHNLIPRYPLSSGEQDNHGTFALKVFENLSDLDGALAQNEVEVHQGVPEHPRIVQLLAAFKHRGDFHLLLPWAEGNDLQKLWSTHPSPSNITWYSLHWFLKECHGIAESIVEIHTPRAPHPPLLEKLLVHTDIKPENILCFNTLPREEERSYMLKLADFGLSVLVNTDTRLESSKLAHIKTYRPPEHDTGENLSTKYDIWCLGCLYLEFVTWAMRGWKGVEEFEVARLEMQDSILTEAWGSVEEDTFFKKIPKRPRIASGVKPHFVNKYEWSDPRKKSSKSAQTKGLSRYLLAGFNRTGYRIHYVVKGEVQRVSDPPP